MKNNIYKNYVIHHFDNLDSTSAKAFQMADLSEINDREIIAADSQNKGRGRLGRDWVSPRGNLYFSLVLRPKCDVNCISQISFIAAISLKFAIKEAFLAQKNPKNVDLVKNKWPNDILVDDKKIAGILLESKIIDKNCDFVVVGVGVNLASNPQNTMFLASNLAEFGINLAPREFLERFLDKFEYFYEKWQNFGFLPIKNLWLEDAWRLKSEIAINLGERKINGIFDEIDNDGCLILRTSQGVEKISVGDVS